MKMKRLVAALSTLAALSAAPAHADFTGTDLTVAPGWELYQTVTAQFDTGSGNFIQLYGNPLGSFNFGGTTYTYQIGTTDTIVSEGGGTLNKADSWTFTTAVQVVALNLYTSQNGQGAQTVLDSKNPSTGTLTVTENGISNKYFTCSGDCYETSFAINASVAGNKISLNLISGGNWTSTPPTGTLLVPGVNEIGFYPAFTKNTGGDGGTGTIGDPGFHIDPEHPGDMHNVVNAVPEPEEYAMMLLGAAMVSFQVKRKAAKQSKMKLA